MEQYSLNELGPNLEQRDLLLEGRLIIHVDVSIERLHERIQTTDDSIKVTTGQGWLVSFTLPTREASAASTPFADGEAQMMGDLHYMGNDEVAVQLEDAIRALGVDRDARIWTVKEAP